LLVLAFSTGCVAPRQAGGPPFVQPLDGFIQRDAIVRLHYLDFGGSGETVLLLPGLGNTAYIYKDFAPLLKQHGFRVVALTRRGHGRSSQPATGFEPDSLADDILAALDNLGIERLHLVGHSFAGVELTNFASRYPKRVRKLVYLDAAYDRRMQFAEERRDPARPSAPSAADRASIASLIAFFRNPDHYYGRVWSSATESDLRERYQPDAAGELQDRTPGRIYGAILRGATNASPDYTKIRAPVLSYYALATVEQLLPAGASPALRDSARVYQREVIDPWTSASINQLVTGVPTARVLRLDDTYHHLFIQRPRETAAEMVAFFRER
jgi:non-heme chloroperoxidase